MRLTIVCAGKLKEEYLRRGAEEYLKRMKPYASVAIAEIAPEKMPEDPSEAQKAEVLTREGERLLARVPEGDFLIALDVGGKEVSSGEFAQTMEELALAGRSRISFLIGGTFGISEDVRVAADRRLRLSALTFTHQMARLILLEQIYRSFKIRRGEHYHW